MFLDLGSVSMVLKRVSGLEERVASLDKRVDMVLRFMLVLNAPLLTAVIGILLKMVLTP